MIVSLRHFLGWLVSWLSCRADLVLENMALRRQLLALHAQRPRRRWTALHKLFWVALRMCWSAWRQPLVLVTPRTVVNWHRAGFRLYWTWVTRIRQVGGRKRVSKEVRAEEHTSELQSLTNLVCRLLLEKKKRIHIA